MKLCIKQAQSFASRRITSKETLTHKDIVTPSTSKSAY